MASWEPLVDNKKGIIYFYNKLNNKIVFDYPKKYNYFTGKYEDFFFENWTENVIMNYDSDEKHNWINIKNGFTQNVNPNSTTFIMEAAVNNNIAFFELFIDSGGNINYTDNLKRNCLHYIAINDNYFLAKLLIKLGCDFDKKDIYGISPFLYCIKYLSLKTMKLLVKNKCNINVKDNEGNTAFHYAVMNENTKLIVYLLEHGVKLNIRNNKRKSPIDIAKNNNSQIYKLLIKYSCLKEDEYYYKEKEFVNSEKYEELLIKKQKILEDEDKNIKNNELIKDMNKNQNKKKSNSNDKFDSGNYINKKNSNLFPFISFKRNINTPNRNNHQIKIKNESKEIFLITNKKLFFYF